MPPQLRQTLTPQAARRPRRVPASRRLSLALPADFPRDVEVIATDLDHTLIWDDYALCGRARSRRSRGRATSGLRVIVVTGRMVQSAAAACSSRPARRAARSATRAPPSSTPTARGSCTCRSTLELAREAIAARRGRGLRARTSTSTTSSTSSQRDAESRALRELPADSSCTRSAMSRLARPAADEARRASATRTRSTARRADAGACSRPALRSRSRCRSSSSSRRSGSRRAPGSTSSPSGSGSRASRRSRSATARTTSSWSSGAGYGVAVENAHARVKAVADWVCPPAAEEGVAAGDRSASRLTGVIDLRAARADPDSFRAALARKGAAERFDALLAADERWRALLPQVDELRGRQKLKGKPTPEQLEELNRVKEELRAAEEELAAAEAERDALLDQVPNPPDPSAPDGDTDEDAEELRRVGDPAPDGPEHTEVGRFEMERAARLSGSRFGYLTGDSALVAMALYRFALDRAAAHGHTPLIPPVLVREEAMYGTGLLPDRASNIYALEADDLYLTGTSEVALAGLPHGRDPRGAAAALRGVLDLLPPRVGRGREGHARDVPRPPVQQGRAVRLLRARALGRGARPAARDRGGARPGARAALPRRQRRRGRPRRLRRRRSTTSRRGSRRSSATARSPRPRTRPTSRPAGSASATAPARSASRRRTR